MSKRGNGDGAYYKRPDGRWEAKITLPGGQRKSVYGRTRSEARTRATQLLDRAGQGLDVRSRDQTLAAFLERWLVDVASRRIRPTTRESYERVIRVRILPALGKTKLTAVTPLQLQALYTRLQDGGLAPASVVRTHAILHGALGQAVRWNLIPRNPADAVSPPSIPRREMSALTRDQVLTLIASSSNPAMQALYAVAATAGLRRGELLALRWSDVDLTRGNITVQRTAHRIRGEGIVYGEPKTNAARRSIRIGAFAVRLLRRHRAVQNQQRLSAGPAWVPANLIFAGPFGAPIEAARISRNFQRDLDTAGLPRVRFHDLRHTAATLLIEQGVPVKAVQATLGHSTIATTMDVYAHLTPAMQDSVAEAMDRLFATPQS